jgi:hypothetical protein
VGTPLAVDLSGNGRAPRRGSEKGELLVKKMATGLALLAMAITAGTAAARNFHCAGGIQYVIQGTKEKDKGNLEDAHRIFGKGVTQLRQCTSEDPNDSEAWSYLGWALAEVDSAPEAGAEFDESE